MESLPASRMRESDQNRVKCLVLKALNFLSNGLRNALAGTTTAVKRVTNDRMTAACHMDPNLVGPASGKAAFDQTGVVSDRTQHLVVSERRLATTRDDRHLLPIARTAPNISLDAALARTAWILF